MTGWFEVTNRLDRRGPADPDPHEVTVVGARRAPPQHDPLQQRRGDDGELVHQRLAQHDAPEAAAGEADAPRRATAEGEHQRPQRRAARHHVLQVGLLDGAPVEDELPQARERRRRGAVAVAAAGVEDAGRGREPPDADAEALQGGAALEEVGGEHVEARPGDVVQGEVADALGGDGADPAGEGVPLGLREVAGQGDGVEGARVVLDDAGHGGGDGGHAGEVRGEDEVGVLEHERRRRPEPVPLRRRQHAGASGGVRDREARHDGGADMARKATDEIFAAHSDTIRAAGGGDDDIKAPGRVVTAGGGGKCK